MHTNVHSSIIYNSQAIEPTEVSIKRLMDEEVIHTHIYGIILYYHNIK